MLSWRDMKNPAKGGAEIVTDIYLRGLVKLGHKVTLFSAGFSNSPKQETYNDYKIIRKGNQLSVHYHGLLYAKNNQNEFDIIIDQINTIPFLTPLLIKKHKRVAFFHQLCLNIWFYETRFPISIIGNIAERIYLKFYYNTRTFVVSNSTKEDLIKYANMKEHNILVLDNQIDFPIVRKVKEKLPYFVFCGRLTKSKRPDHIIKAISKTKNKNVKLIIIGNGNEKYKSYLMDLVNELNIKDRVIFKGSITNKERNELMQKALAILVTSVREGWGLIVTEANANGTIAITYDTEGLRDANTNKTGIITENNNPKTLAKHMDFIIENPKIRKEKETRSLRFAKEHNDWDKNVKKLEKWLKKEK